MARANNSTFAFVSDGKPKSADAIGLELFNRTGMLNHRRQLTVEFDSDAELHQVAELLGVNYFNVPTKLTQLFDAARSRVGMGGPSVDFRYNRDTRTMETF